MRTVVSWEWWLRALAVTGAKHRERSPKKSEGMNGQFCLYSNVTSTSQSPGELVYMQFLRWGLAVCISHKLPSANRNMDAAATWTVL